MAVTSVFVAGASGAIGMRLVPLLVQAGYAVTGTTRSPERARRLAALGAEPASVDVFDAAALDEACKKARPRIVIHQLTDLAQLASGNAASPRAQCTHSHRRHAQPHLGCHQCWRPEADRPEHRLGLRARRGAACRNRSAPDSG